MYSPWNSPGQNTGVGSLSLLQGIFPTQGLNPDLMHCRQILYQLSHKGSQGILEWVAYPFSSRSSRSRNLTGSPALQADSLPTELSGKSLDSGKQERLYCPFQNPFPPFDPFSTQHLLRQALRIPWTEEPGGLQSMELQRV